MYKVFFQDVNALDKQFQRHHLVHAAHEEDEIVLLFTLLKFL